MPAPVIEKIIGHRGACGYAPENTIASFDKARALGCRFIEFDVMLSADGEPFVFHDESLKRTTNGNGDIGLVNADYLQSLDAGGWFARHFRGEKIPHLRDVLKWLVFADANANIEIKPYPSQTEATTVAVLTHVNRYWPADKPMPLLSSFDKEALVLCRSLAPEMPLGLLLDTWEDNWHEIAQDLQCYSIHLNRRLVTAERVAAMKQQGYKVLAYTVNRKRQALKLFRAGVDAVFSDYPDLLV